MIDLGEQHYLPLRRNLTEVLHRIRHKQQPRTLWIDALCINQFDSAEQAQQLQLMADIYRGCKSVLVWLGIPTAHSALGMEFLSYLANSNIQIDSDSAPWNHFSPAESRAALQDILGRPYFQRLWVVQEAALAPRVVMQVGQLSLEWAHGPPTRKFLARLKMAELSPSWQHSEELRDGVDSRPLRELLEQSLAADARRSGTVEVPSLLDVIHSLRHRRVTDPRDQIYAAMSLASPAEVADLVPDYSLSWEGTYQRFFDLVERQVRGNPEVTLDEMTRVGG
ncbi:heterokaryon incompatibility protein-domain-containing protein [Hypoxylon sp. FL0543]|nr:heterokaryon incompatibility protein-domain-containing protein [Hypoxylon sp. FL0543]